MFLPTFIPSLKRDEKELRSCAFLVEALFYCRPLRDLIVSLPKLRVDYPQLLRDRRLRHVEYLCDLRLLETQDKDHLNDHTTMVVERCNESRHEALFFFRFLWLDIGPADRLLILISNESVGSASSVSEPVDQTGVRVCVRFGSLIPL